MDKIEQVAKGLGWVKTEERLKGSVRLIRWTLEKRGRGGRIGTTTRYGTASLYKWLNTPAGQIAVQERLLGMGWSIMFVSPRTGGIPDLAISKPNMMPTHFPTLIDALIWAAEQTPELLSALEDQKDA